MSTCAPISMSCLPEETAHPDVADTMRLVQVILGGDTAAFEQIILRHEHRVMTMAARLLGARDDAKDVAQEVFLRAFKYLHRLDVTKPIEPWLMRITINVCRDQARVRQRRRATFVDAEAAEPIDDAPGPYDGFARRQEQRLLHQALDSLPEKERLAILLRDVEGLSTAEVAEILESSTTTVRSQVSRGRLRLKAALDRLLGGKP